MKSTNRRINVHAIFSVPIEAAVFIREYLNNWYRLTSYYSVKILSDLPLQVSGIIKLIVDALIRNVI